ncbi:Outer membrane efflux protein [Candidatus Sulfotelmatobacter kueseliae]|uniref:Outer membrane efflux protein n=1 Tax=Candidatus Sulfotelmatobacter kueseliae TaxID=2042962 RepID=A0A2U3KMZ0_9BACT|nr:Outer membrane efflux protein [Candidatus Sulfotelmatobacter kueseliae]
MLVPRLIFPVRLRFYLAAALFLMFTAALGAQQATPPAAPQPVQPQLIHLKDYSVPRSAFPRVLQPYLPAELAQPNLGNSPRIDALMRDGKLYLSIDDAVALALENNLDIDIARYNLNIAEADLLRAKSGATILGVNAGIVQNTPGGGVGGLGGTVGSGTGGTTVAASGAGTGTNGLVSSTLGIGAPITSFDPQVTSTLQLDKNDMESTSALSPVPILAQNTYTANFGYTQGFQWGTTMTAAFNNTHLTTNNPTSLLSPALASNFQFRVTQNLLQGFGSLPNTRFIRIAKNNREISDVAFRLQVITTVDQIENIYWDLVYAYENVRVQQESLTYAQKALDDAKHQAQVGTVPPIQVVSAQSTVATDLQNLIVAQNNLQLQQLLTKNALSRSIEDPVLAEADVVPTSTMQLPQEETVIPIQDLINDALRHRAELVESRIDLNSRDINNKAVRNSMLPSLDLFAYYGGSGVGGDLILPACSGTATLHCYTTIPPPFANTTSVGYGATLNQLVNSTAPDKGIGLTLTIPLRNRVAQANQVRAELEYRQAEVREKQLENQVRIEVRNAQFDVRQNRVAVQAAQSAVDLARQTLNADQEKLKVGLTTQVTILQDAATLTTGESNLVSAKAAYEKSRVELDRATGLLLDHAGIDVADATRGAVTHLPNVPYVAPRPDAVPTAPSSSNSAADPSAQQGGQM